MRHAANVDDPYHSSFVHVHQELAMSDITVGLASACPNKAYFNK